MRAIHYALFTLVVACGFWACAQRAQGQSIQEFDDGDIHVLHVQGNVYLLAGAGGNITIEAGDQGVVLVDAGSADHAARVLAVIQKVSKRPIRFIIDTAQDADRIGGNEILSSAGITVAGALNQSNELDASPGAQLVAHENVYNRLSGLNGGKRTAPPGTLPLDIYPGGIKKLFVNEGIAIIHIPSAHTDGDSIVHFRGSDVVSAGEIFNTTSYPIIDLANGGSVQGIINGLNRILEIAIPKQEEEGGTYVIPGHGRIGDQFDVLEYRDMVTIVRDRIQALIKKGVSLQQIKAARPTEEYDDLYGSRSGSWTTDMFVEAVYKSLVGKK